MLAYRNPPKVHHIQWLITPDNDNREQVIKFIEESVEGVNNISTIGNHRLCMIRAHAPRCIVPYDYVCANGSIITGLLDYEIYTDPPQTEYRLLPNIKLGDYILHDTKKGLRWSCTPEEFKANFTPIH